VRRKRRRACAWALGAACVLEARTALASGGEGASPYFGDIGQTLATVAIFLVLLAVLGKFAWKPILAQLRRREESIAGALDAAAQRERKSQELLAEYSRRLDGIEEEARAVLARSRQEGAAAREVLLAEAREEARRLSDEQRRDIEQAKTEALRELHEKTAELAADMAGAVLRRRLSPQDHGRILGQSLQDIRRRGEDN
jgi:F-type H+-transporting ATPase subunit b